MKLKISMILLSFVMLTGCCSTGGCGSCGGCDVGYWSTTCYIPNSCGASESAFTDIATTCGGPCARAYYTTGCWTSSCSSNW